MRKILTYFGRRMRLIKESQDSASAAVAERPEDMKKRLHLVFGGELIDPSKSRFKDLESVEIVGLFPDYPSAREAWQEASQRSVDNALKRYFIARLSRLIDENRADGPSEELGG